MGVHAFFSKMFSADFVRINTGCVGKFYIFAFGVKAIKIRKSITLNPF